MADNLRLEYTGPLDSIGDFLKLVRAEIEWSAQEMRNKGMKQDSFPKVKEHHGRSEGLLKAAKIMDDLFALNFKEQSEDLLDNIGDDDDDETLLEKFNGISGGDFENDKGDNEEEGPEEPVYG